MGKRIEEKDNLTPEQVEAELKAIQLRLSRAQLSKAEMELELTEEAVEAHKARKHGQKIHNAQRQSQLRKDLNDRAKTARDCTHRQGGRLKSNKGGKGPSVLNVFLYPMRRLISCTICQMRLWEPWPADATKRQRAGESKDEMIARVEKYHEDAAEFAKMLEHSQDKLTEEAAQPMDCGVEMKFLNSEGNQVQVKSPCDFYAQGLDNRKGVAA